MDHCIDAMMRGIRETGDGRPFFIQLAGDKSISNDNPYWASRVDWNFVYTSTRHIEPFLRRTDVSQQFPPFWARPTTRVRTTSPRPPTTDDTLRRQVLWALTSARPGGSSAATTGRSMMAGRSDCYLAGEIDRATAKFVIGAGRVAIGAGHQ